MKVAVPPPRLLRAYRDTNYSAAGVSIRIGRPVPDILLDRLGTDIAVLVTAWNPLSRRMPEGWNRRMQYRLRAHLRRNATMQAEGSLHGWREAMLLVAGDPRPIIRVAIRFRQLGVVILRRGRMAQLQLL